MALLGGRISVESIEAYTDYRIFLRDFYQNAKRKRAHFSYRFFCKRAGIRSPGLYRDVVEGRRNLTAKTIQAFSKGLGLNASDAKYFHTLVRFNQSKTAAEREELAARLQQMLLRVTAKPVPSQYQIYYSRWYYSALRELACLIDWQGDYALLGQSLEPPISRHDTREAVQLLMRFGFLRRLENGRVVQSDPYLVSGPEDRSAAIRKVNGQFSMLGTRAICHIDAKRRDISGMTMGISEQTYQCMKDEIKEFRNRLKRLIVNQAEGEADQVYYINIQLFPLSVQQKSDTMSEPQKEVPKFQERRRQHVVDTCNSY